MIQFHHQFTNALPADPILENSTRQVVGSCYSLVEPSKAKRPELGAQQSGLLDAVLQFLNGFLK
jgi:hypothetical protein